MNAFTMWRRVSHESVRLRQVFYSGCPYLNLYFFFFNLLLLFFLKRHLTAHTCGQVFLGNTVENCLTPHKLVKVKGEDIIG